MAAVDQLATASNSLTISDVQHLFKDFLMDKHFARDVLDESSCDDEDSPFALTYDSLPSECERTTENPYPHLIHFAVPVSWLSVLQTAARLHRAGLLSDDDVSLKNHNLAGLTLNVVRHLSCKHNCEPLTFAYAFCAPPGTHVVIQLYSNYTRSKKKPEGEKLEEILRDVQKQFGVEDAEPKWYYDRDYDEPSVLPGSYRYL
ncbi:hypothetical protein EIP91_000854 [Steccherinum ochraceum]|uniref:Uncharacterized protein n=1 Tax=Steccherinum ochraceum TaxID=92696 RepID=A0A4R0S180_9APHY|nr:hypothetical protein EIP91_000854 [Steccherinum ochraceum]